MNLFFKLNQKYINWYVKRQKNKQKNEKLTETEIKRVEFVRNLKGLYHFVRWLNNEGFSNRHQKKVFWRNVKEGQPVLEKVMENLINRYSNSVIKNPKIIDKSKKDEK